MNRRNTFSRSYWKPVAGFTAAGIWLIAPFAAVAGVLLVMSSAQIVPDADVWVAPVSAVDAKERAVGLDMTWSSSQSLFAPDWQGVVQRVGITSGDEVSTGTNVARVGDIERIAAATAVPFNSSLQRGDSGPAVRALNTMLSELDIAEHGPDDEFTRATLRGVRELAGRAGVSEAEKVLAFDPSWVVFIPSSPVVVEVIELEVGARAMAPGSVIASTKPVLEAVSLVDAAVVRNSAQLDQEVETAVILPAVVAADSEALRVAAIDMVLNEDRASLTAEARVALTAVVQTGVRFTGGSLVQPAVGDEFEVPASSIITDASGITCVVAERAPGLPTDKTTDKTTDTATTAPKLSEAVHSVIVVVTGSQAGTAWVTGELAAENKIMVAPRGDDRRCGA